MTIIVPQELEDSIRAAVKGGHFASVDEAMAEAARLLIRRFGQGEASPPQPAADGIAAVPSHKQPIWELVDELRRGVPPEEFAKLPRDGAEQLDHYLVRHADLPNRPAPR